MDLIRSYADMETADTEGDAPTLFKARAELGVRSFGLSVEEFPANSSEGFYPKHEHSDTNQEEVYLCFDGSGECQLGDTDWQPVERGQFIHVDPKTPRQFRSGDNGLTLVIISGPIDGRYEDVMPAWTEKSASQEQSESGQSGSSMEDETQKDKEHEGATQTS